MSALNSDKLVYLRFMSEDELRKNIEGIEKRIHFCLGALSALLLVLCMLLAIF